jgi:ribonuclease HI
MHIDVYTDGACSKNGKQGARASWAMWFPYNKQLSKAARVPEDQSQTNQRGELMAIHEAVKAVEDKFDPRDVDLRIYTDSLYSKNCLTTWIPGWIQKDWKNSQGQPVVHRDLIEDTASRLSKFKSYTISHVKAHTGGSDSPSVNNAIADKMAVEVLNPKEKAPEVKTNKEVPVEGMPLELMGPPIDETLLASWVLNNSDKLDQECVKAALLTALSKTLKKKGFELVRQRLHRRVQYRLKTDTGLITEGVIVVKEE